MKYGGATLLGSASDTALGYATNIRGAAIVGNYAYVVGAVPSTTRGSISVVNITTLSAPVLAGAYVDPTVNYYKTITTDGTYLYVTDNSSRLLIFNVTT